MTQLVQFFENIASWQRTVILLSGLVLFWSIEGILPFRRLPRTRYRHAWLNLFFHATTVVINFAFAGLILVASDFARHAEIGLLQWVTLPLLAQIVVSILLLDLVGAWLVHYVEHKVRWMWKFHLVHHSDTHIDVTSSLRHHPGESVFRALFTTMAVLLAGAPMWAVMLYQGLSALFSQFNHAHIRLPVAAEKVLGLVFVTPGLHHVHHHYTQPYTDANYGNIFSIWDRLFGTMLYLPQDQIVYGLDTHPHAHEHNTMAGLLRAPFQSYRAPTSGSHRPETIE
jgi:sterol desaturase/sphingolipid hydroxylase (fatty acid hydroxylase superfamily)